MVRYVERDELPRINELRSQVNDHHAKGRPDIFRPDFSPELAEHLYDYYNGEGSGVIAAFYEGTLAGFACVEYIHKPESPYQLARDYYHVNEFGVDAAFRRHGIATELMAFIRRDAAERGFARIELDMWEFNEGALAFYEKEGFMTCRRYMELPL